MGRLIIDGNRVYELDEACLQRKKKNRQITEADRNLQLQKEREQHFRKNKKW